MTFRDIEQFRPGRTERSLDRHLRKFHELDRDSAGLGGSSVVNNYYTAIPTVFVASSVAPDWIIEAASNMTGGFVCDGIADEEEINAACTSGIGGRVVLSSGNFNISSSIQMDFDQQLIGMGWLSTVIRTTVDGINMIDLESSFDCLLSDFALDYNAGANSVVGVRAHTDGINIQNIWFEGMFTGVDLRSNTFHMSNSYMQGTSEAIVGDGAVEAVITGNNLRGRIELGFWTDKLILSSNTVRSGNILLDGALGGSDNGRSFIHIASNFFHEGAGVDDAWMTIKNSHDVSIVGNHAYPRLFNGIEVSGVKNLFISSNEIYGMDEGIRVTNCDKFKIIGNDIGGDPLDNGGLLEHAIVVDGSRYGDILNNIIHEPGGNLDNSYDGVFITGVSEDIWVDGNRIHPPNFGEAAYTARYGINIGSSCVDIRIGKNDLYPLADWGTAAINDQAADTRYNGVNQSIFSKSGVLGTGSGTFKLPFDEPVWIVDVKIAVGVAPVGQDLIVDINKNGTTIFSTQANRPTITDGNEVSARAVPDVHLVAADEYLTVDLDQVGSTTQGEDLTVTVRYIY